MICHILYSRLEYSENVGFDSDGSSLIVDNSYNAQICSEKDMFNENVESTISNGVATIGGKDIIIIGIFIFI